MAKETFGQRLRRLRTARNISQDQMAEALKTTRQTISNWENDKSAIDHFSLQDIKNILFVSWDDLMGGREAERRQKIEMTFAKKSPNEEYAERNIKNGHTLPRTDLKNISEPGTYTITHDDLKIAYHIGSFCIDNMVIAEEAHNLGFIITGITYISFTVKLENNERVKEFREFLERLFSGDGYEHRPRVNLAAQYYSEKCGEFAQELTKDAVKRIFGIDSDEIFILMEKFENIGYFGSADEAKDYAEQNGISEYRVMPL
ncbi:MAG: helix-turn-helix domain-containing protein [Candidatus Saccharibacteria bacterium]|nr:helix-turn-helix domain-containing protein [Candidatus Saccharibacteria bacterium]